MVGITSRVYLFLGSLMSGRVECIASDLGHDNGRLVRRPALLRRLLWLLLLLITRVC